MVSCVGCWILVEVGVIDIGVEVSAVDVWFSEKGLFGFLDFLVFLGCDGFGVSCCVIVTFCGNISSSLCLIVGVSRFAGMGVSSMFGLLLSYVVGLFVGCESYHMRR